MSEKLITLTEARLQELFELTIAKTQAIQNQEAPGAVIHNSNVSIYNSYGDTYEEDRSNPAPPPPAEEKKTDRARVKDQGETFFIRAAVSNLMIGAEKLMQSLEKRNPDGFTENAASAKAALSDRFADLQLRLKGDTSLENVREAYLWMVIQLALSSDLGEVFNG